MVTNIQYRQPAGGITLNAKSYSLRQYELEVFVRTGPHAQKSQEINGHSRPLDPD